MPEPNVDERATPEEDEAAALAAEQKKERLRKSPDYQLIKSSIEVVGQHLTDFLVSSELPFSPSTATAYVKMVQNELPFFSLPDATVREMLAAYLFESAGTSSAPADRIEEAMAVLRSTTQADGNARAA